MIRTRPSPIAALAVLVAGILATAACGGSGGDGAGATAAPDTAEAVVTTPTVPAGACTERAPDPKPDPKSYPAPPPQTIDTSHAYTATLATSCGDIVIALDPAEAPVTVNNFVFLARQGFYNGLTFHRVVAGFVIQGGDPTGTGSGDAGYAFDDELPKDGSPRLGRHGQLGAQHQRLAVLHRHRRRLAAARTTTAVSGRSPRASTSRSASRASPIPTRTPAIRRPRSRPSRSTSTGSRSPRHRKRRRPDASTDPQLTGPVRLRRSASSSGRLRKGQWPPSISSGMMPRRSRTTRRTQPAGNTRSSRHRRYLVGTSGHASSGHGSVPGHRPAPAPSSGLRPPGRAGRRGRRRRSGCRRAPRDSAAPPARSRCWRTSPPRTRPATGPSRPPAPAG